MSKLYTRRGDDGRTMIPVRGSTTHFHRVVKHAPAVKAMGEVDELQAHLGLLVAMNDELRSTKFLPGVGLVEDQDGRLPWHVDFGRIQDRLWQLFTNVTLVDGEAIRPLSTEDLEQWIDSLGSNGQRWARAGANQINAQAHVCRTVCRRAERELTYAIDCQPELAVAPDAVAFLNRLSDLLFAVACWSAAK